MRIVAVIVTNNRFALLQEAVQAVKNQLVKVSDIVVVNNGSTDETEDWLLRQDGISVINQDNLGGSGGFYTGIKKAIDLKADWAWVMDDDTICQADTLLKLTEKIASVEDGIGFIGSKCIWKDGSPHLMNLPAIKPKFNDKIPFNKYDNSHLLLIETCSFVSLLINASAIKKVGLPYKEFFIWGDDQEYTRRITENGFLGFYCVDSTVLHKTPINHFPDFYRETPNNIWKHEYGFRNEFFMKKKNKGFAYFIFWLAAKVGYTSYKILKIRKDNHLKFIGVILTSAYKSIFFSPKIVNV